MQKEREARDDETKRKRGRERGTRKQQLLCYRFCWRSRQSLKREGFQDKNKKPRLPCSIKSVRKATPRTIRLANCMKLSSEYTKTSNLQRGSASLKMKREQATKSESTWNFSHGKLLFMSRPVWFQAIFIVLVYSQSVQLLRTMITW